MVLLLWQKNGSLLLRRRFFPLSRGGGEKNSKEVSIRRFVPTLALPLLFPLFSGSTEIKDFFLDSFHGGKRTSATEVFRLHPDILREKDVEGDRRAEL